MLSGSTAIPILLNSSASGKPDQIHHRKRCIHAVNMAAKEIQAGVVVSGASGMLGTALRSALADRKTPVIQLVRGAPTSEGQLQWDPEAYPLSTHLAALDGCAAAIHLSGASVAGHLWTEAYRRELATSRVDSTRALSTALAGLQRPPQKLLVASAVGIYGHRIDELLDEGSAPGTGFLASLCQEWEAAAQPAVQAGIRVAHLRFGVVLGRGQGALAQMLLPFRLGLGGKLGTGRQWTSWVSLSDVVAGILFALDSPSLKGPINLTSPYPVTNAEFTRALARQLHRPAVLPVPAFLLRLAFGQMADEVLLSSARAVPTKLRDAGFQFLHSTIEMALAAALR
jgi:uncharacterized protein (TIGR01777 family)